MRNYLGRMNGQGDAFCVTIGHDWWQLCYMRNASVCKILRGRSESLKEDKNSIYSSLALFNLEQIFFNTTWHEDMNPSVSLYGNRI